MSDAVSSEEVLPLHYDFYYGQQIVRIDLSIYGARPTQQLAPGQLAQRAGDLLSQLAIYLPHIEELSRTKRAELARMYRSECERTGKKYAKTHEDAFVTDHPEYLRFRTIRETLGRIESVVATHHAPRMRALEREFVDRARMGT